MTIFQSISNRLTERGRKKREVTDERKMSKQPTPAVGPFPTIIQITGTPALEVYPAQAHCPTTSTHCFVRNRPTAEKANFESLLGLVFNLLSVKVFDKNRKI